jgi:NAD(P)-dependent dehydrogenase (short-subunit alcohol dehydrogenase family)
VNTILDCEFQRSLAIGVTAPFYLSKLFAPHFAEGASIINISSSRDRIIICIGPKNKQI